MEEILPNIALPILKRDMWNSYCAILVLLTFPVLQGAAQGIGKEKSEGIDWNRTRMILECAPRLVDRMDLVEDNFDHRYVTNNPRDIEVGYFSVEPITYLEEGRRFCEALLPAAGVSQTYFRGSYVTTYTLPGPGVYSIRIESNALIFNNDIRVIDAQNTVGEIEASHRLEADIDTFLNPATSPEAAFVSNQAYSWVLEIDQSGAWNGELTPGVFDLRDAEVPSGFSVLSLERRVKGPGVVTIRESVIFQVNAISAYKYDPIFQAPCLFSLEPLGITARLLPCEK
jgi:hypothetical protein